MKSCVELMIRYMAWADHVLLTNAEQLERDQLVASRDTLFGSVSGTFDHVVLVAEIFQAHLEGRPHRTSALRRETARPFDVVAADLRAINQYYVSLASRLTEPELSETISFRFIDGGEGEMTRAQILLHLANHATYHRGFVSTLLYPISKSGTASDLTVFLRDADPATAYSARSPSIG